MKAVHVCAYSSAEKNTAQASGRCCSDADTNHGIVTKAETAATSDAVKGDND